MRNTTRTLLFLLGLCVSSSACGGRGTRVGPGDAGSGTTDSGTTDSGTTLTPPDSGTSTGPGGSLPDGSGDCVGDPVSLLGVSMDRWSYGNVGTGYMRPGGDCMDCHVRNGGPRFTVAGSVMDAWHEPDDCFGMQGVTVEITGADGVVTRLTTNETGNFYSSDSISVPYRVKLTGADGSVREMLAPQTDLDCMSCHTQAGANGAPGRIGHP